MRTVSEQVLGGRNRVIAWLGPTNTGKTHQAITQMLRYPTGMIGLPLRLLAREVYDKVVALKSEDQVALVTGEEKIVPPQAKYFICTVEAMPVSRAVHFLAVDEIQLAGDANRGHAFTHRLLHARGVIETWFLGSQIIESLLKRLVPSVEIFTASRRSRLEYGQQEKLNRLPNRSAVVCFGVEHCYEIAEQIRATFGGVAVVLGALSPATRNAQVQLYQSGKVQHIVATDAIGLGLNLDIRHIWFAATRKFDGKRRRPLVAHEVAQIAGRAGRNKENGTFGTLNSTQPLDEQLVDSVIRHQFRQLPVLFWRNNDLDFRSVHKLLDSLDLPSHTPGLVKVVDAEDRRVLSQFCSDPAFSQVALTKEQVKVLWEICRVPDYRKTTSYHHYKLLSAIAQVRLRGEQLDDETLKRRISPLNRLDGDIEWLMTRIAYIRTWTYITHQEDWVENVAYWRQEALNIEQRLSEALHQKLAQRFVDRRVRRVKTERLDALDTQDNSILINGEVIARVVRGHLHTEQALHQSVLRVATIKGQHLAIRWAEQTMSAPWHLRDNAEVSANGTTFARLSKGAFADEPVFTLSRMDLVPSQLRESWLSKGQLWARSLIPQMLQIQKWPAPTSAAMRGLQHAVVRGLGDADLGTVNHLLCDLQASERRQLRRSEVHIGRLFVYSKAAFTAPALQLREQLSRLFSGTYHGYRVLLGHTFRVDELERFMDSLKNTQGELVSERALADQLQITSEVMQALLSLLGVQFKRSARQRLRILFVPGYTTP